MVAASSASASSYLSASPTASSTTAGAPPTTSHARPRSRRPQRRDVNVNLAPATFAPSSSPIIPRSLDAAAAAATSSRRTRRTRARRRHADCQRRFGATLARPQRDHRRARSAVAEPAVEVVARAAVLVSVVAARACAPSGGSLRFLELIEVERRERQHALAHLRHGGLERLPRPRHGRVARAGTRAVAKKTNFYAAFAWRGRTCGLL